MSTTSKSENFFNIIKSVGFPNVNCYSAANFDFLFRIQTTTRFFDWFLANVTNETCCLTVDELREFELKKSRGQVIWDLNRLEQMSTLLQSNLKTQHSKLRANKSSSSSLFDFEKIGLQSQDICRDQTVEMKSSRLNENDREEGEMQGRMKEEDDDDNVENDSVDNGEDEGEDDDEEMSSSGFESTIGIGCDESIESLTKDNERKAKLLDMLAEQLRIRKCQRARMSERLREMRGTSGISEKRCARLEKKTNERDNEMRALTQSLNKSQSEFEMKFGNEDNFFGNLTNVLKDNETSVEAYVSCETSLLQRISQVVPVRLDLARMKFDFANDIQRNDTETAFILREREQLKLNETLPRLYSKLYDESYSTKTDYELVRVRLAEMKWISENLDEFFGFGHQSREAMESKLTENETKAALLDAKSKILISKVCKATKCLTYLSMGNSIDESLTRHVIESSLLLNKQSKLLRCLQSQRERIELFNYVDVCNSSELHSLRQLLEDLVKQKILFMTNATPQLSPAQSMLVLGENTALTANQHQHQNHLQSTLATGSSFSASMASLLSLNTQEPTSNRLGRKIASHFDLASQQSISQSHSFGTSLATSSPSRIIRKNDDQFYYIFNQFLISALRSLEATKSIENVCRLSKPISIDLNDNLENYFHVYNTVHSYYVTNSLHSMQRSLALLESSIGEAMAYMYERVDVKDNKEHKNDDGNGKTVNFNFNRVRVKGPKCLHDSLGQLNKATSELQDAFYVKVFQAYNCHKVKLNSNKLEQLKRNIFVHFFNNPQQIELIVNHLNSHLN